MDDTDKKHLKPCGDGDPLSIPALFASQVDRTPEACAVVFEDQQLHYRDIDRMSSALARVLIERGVQSGDIVGVILPRCALSAVAVLGVLKSGAAYVPVDPTHPRSRAAFILSDAAVVAVVTTTELTSSSLSLLRSSGRDHAFVVNVDESLIDNESAISPAFPDPRQLAYLIYTSGTTGIPKGVAVMHTGIGQLVATHARRQRISANSRILQFSPLVFDASVINMWSALLTGATAVVPNERQAQPGPALNELISGQKVTHVHVTPSTLAVLSPEGWGSVESLLMGGEICSAKLADQWSDHFAMANTYGPTETTVYVSMTRPLRAGQHVPPIGSPVSGVVLIVLDQRLRRSPSGAVGELYIGGCGVAQGYWRQPSMTASRFVADPFSSGRRLYRTGDLVRWNRRGELEFIGRVDDQIKIRGHRIEPGEIEGMLNTYPGVKQAVVVARESQWGEKQLVGYIVADDVVDIVAVRQYLKERLPLALVPAAITRLDTIPLTVNGKVDRQALPVPAYRARMAYQAPRTAVQKLVAELFADVLGLPQVGIDEDFFELGGHSLSAIRLVSRIRTMLEIEVPIHQVFDAPTVAELTVGFDTKLRLRPPLTPKPRPLVVPLSFAQSRLWFLHRLEGQSATYNIPMAWSLNGPLDLQALRAAVSDVVSRHEPLRTIFPEIEGVPRQEVLASEDLESVWATMDVVGWDPIRIADTVAATARHAFDLAVEAPIRVSVLRCSGDNHVLVLLVHHIASDGWSEVPLIQDLSFAYRARMNGAAPQWTSLPVAYVDYALWQRDVLGSRVDPDSIMSAQIDYWCKELAGAPPLLELPTDRPRPRAATYQGETIDFVIDPAVQASVRELANRESVTVSMILQSALIVLLHRLGAGRDIVIGSLIAGRTDEAVHALVGFFANTWVLRAVLTPNMLFADLLAQVRQKALAAYENQDVPFDVVIEKINPIRSASHHPLFQTMLVFQNNTKAVIDFPGVEATRTPVRTGVSRLDLTWTVEDCRGACGWSGSIEYASDLYDEKTVASLAKRFVRVLADLARGANSTIGSVELLDDTELLQLEKFGSCPIASSEKVATITELFRAQVSRTPDSTAVVFESDSWTYAQLDVLAGRMATQVAAVGVASGARVALLLPRSASAVVAILAVLRLGAAYVPIDVAYPRERIRHILIDAAPSAAITTVDLIVDTATLLRDIGIPIVDVTDSPADTLPVTPETPTRTTEVAYLIYTSGTTGTPKGVAVTHANVCQLFTAMSRKTDIGTTQTWSSTHSYAFDFSVWEYGAALLHGGKLVIIPDTIVRDPLELARLLDREHVTVLSQTPTAFEVLQSAVDPSISCSALQTVVFGGEVLPSTTIQSWREKHPDVRLINMYGTTETTVFSSSHEICRTEAGKLICPIGTPLPGQTTYVLDDLLRRVPVGVPGELYVGGVGVSQGYWRKPTLTAARFIADHIGEAGQRLYRTGDLVRWRQTGELEFLGRTDDQIKIRGFRIEPDELQSVLTRHPDIAQAMVVIAGKQPIDRHLLAYVTPAETVGDFDFAAVRQYVANRLPSYMVPTAIIPLDRIPLTINGKLDKQALPLPMYRSITADQEPITDTEKGVAELFVELLGLTHAGVDDNFFHVGGHSLSVVRLSSAIRKKFGVDVTVRTVFEDPSVSGLASAIDTRRTCERQEC
ncbi:non-ribosomal peptide synthetase [Nocardia brasiliensis]|uniref:non-ribosomal peptide synthetase n=1 Tax=Nocardia brasiliensis TaxID=37326 RepID=UPI0024560226|nr:non-ribosomal peptide synthetase [Nocardia brasiliensis]